MTEKIIGVERLSELAVVERLYGVEQKRRYKRRGIAGLICIGGSLALALFSLGVSIFSPRSSVDYWLMGASAALCLITLWIARSMLSIAPGVFDRDFTEAVDGSCKEKSALWRITNAFYLTGALITCGDIVERAGGARLKSGGPQP